MVAIRSIIASAQHRIATALGVDERARTQTVAAMLENNRKNAPGYWIQLTLAMGIATLGIVLNSTTVVIGAMLVSPLMGPIVELGMGFAVGSSFLVLRASLRVALSVLVVVGGAALLTVALPFHEITGEIAARTAPTALDLLVAIFCALTAAYTTVRPASDTTAAAAGTAIGIALVPPLCVTGFGLGTGSAALAGGAALLFTANLSAILVLSVLSFLVLGYNQVNAEVVESQHIRPDLTRTGKLAARAQAALHHAFGSRYGLAMRLIIPGVFLAAVYVPLVRALDEVTWEVRARDSIRRVLAAEAPRAVQTAIAVEQHSVTLHLVLIGSDERAASVQRRIETAIATSTGVTPTVSVTAVPDAATLATAATPTRMTASADAIDIGIVRQRIATAIDVEWPAEVAGPLAGWDLVVPSHATPAIVVHHIGPPLGAAAQSLLASRWSKRIGARIVVRDAALMTTNAVARIGREVEWLASARPILDWAAEADGAQVCISAPVASSRQASASERNVIATLRDAVVARAGRATIRDSSGWNIRVDLESCAAASPGPPPTAAIKDSTGAGGR
jgi:uncharacterized hydrophobic protein (TIGR00271 family)